MAYTLGYWPAADQALDALEADPAAGPVLQAVYRTLERLAQDPFEPRLGTITFMSDELGGICATPARHDEWYVLWQRGPEPQSVDIVAITRLSG